ncbi:MAG: hypothetical protein Ct9H300mP31_09150 [Acidimicrobiaceae bacterium]|nr:MAG: hypothetical protein Ct9H300mP31_09150 [Acidimicrobiaceae bacterium]
MACLEHGNLVDAATASHLAGLGTTVVPTLVTYWAFRDHAEKFGFPERNQAKNDGLFEQGRAAIGLFRDAGVELGFGTDLLGEAQPYQNQEFAIRAELEPAVDVLRSMYVTNVRLCDLVGKVGTVSPGAYGDLVVTDVDPLEDLAARALTRRQRWLPWCRAVAQSLTGSTAEGVARTVGLQIGLGSRIRKSPFFEALVRHGLTHVTVYNHMYMPGSFGDPDEEYRALVERVSLWDVAAERQVEVVGPDAFALCQYVSARDLRGMKTGRVRYAPMCDYDGILINDPMVLKLAEDRFWISIADSDLLLWCRAVPKPNGTWTAGCSSPTCRRWVCRGREPTTRWQTYWGSGFATSHSSDSSRQATTASRSYCAGPDGAARAGSNCSSRTVHGAWTSLGRRVGSRREIRHPPRCTDPERADRERPVLVPCRLRRGGVTVGSWPEPLRVTGP